MKKDQFRYNLARAGYSCEQIAFAERVMRQEAMMPCHPDEMRQAACNYLMICTDITKLRGFLLKVDEINRGYALSFDQAQDIVLNIIVGWCH